MFLCARFASVCASRNSASSPAGSSKGLVENTTTSPRSNRTSAGAERSIGTGSCKCGNSLTIGRTPTHQTGGGHPPALASGLLEKGQVYTLVAPAGQAQSRQREAILVKRVPSIL